MKNLLKANKQAYYKCSATLDKRKKIVYTQESFDFFTQNTVRSLPFMSKYITVRYNKHLINKTKDRFMRLKNILYRTKSDTDDVDRAFDRLNFIRIKIMILERDIQAYRNALANTFDASDTNTALQKKIHRKYAKLRKFDAYQNLTLGIIYNDCILVEKIKMYEKEAKDNKEKIAEKYNDNDTLAKIQKNFIFKIIYSRQDRDNIFRDDVKVDTLQNILLNDPSYNSSLLNIATFTQDYINKNPGALSTEFVKFKAMHKNANINTIVKDYLTLYLDNYPDTSSDDINFIQMKLLSSFTYKDFKSSGVFYDLDRANYTNDILMKAKITFAKMEMCKELEYCLHLPEINNYFRILENKDRIKNYVVSAEKLFVQRIEEEFPEIKSTAFIYLYNKVSGLLKQYQNDIIATEQYFISDFLDTVLSNEFDKPNDKNAVKRRLSDIAMGIYHNSESIEAKNRLDLYTRIMTQFYYIKTLKSIDLYDKLDSCKLFHGILVTQDLKPILPIDVQRKIINMPLEAQMDLATNWQNTTSYDLLDDFYVTSRGNMKLDKNVLEFGDISLNTIKHFALTQQISRLTEYIYYNSDNPDLEDEINLADYIKDGINEDIDNLVASSIMDHIPEDMLYMVTPETDEEEDKEDSPATEPEEEEEEILTPEEEKEKQKILEVQNYNKAKIYIDKLLKAEDVNVKTQMLLRLQKRINSGDLVINEVQIDNLNENLNPIGLSLRTPYAYVEHLITKYTEDGRDLNSLQVGLKLRIRMGNLILTDEEIEKINNDHNFELTQKSALKTIRKKNTLSMKYPLTGEVSEKYREIMSHSEALLRRTLKKKKVKLNQFDYSLFAILQQED